MMEEAGTPVPPPEVAEPVAGEESTPTFPAPTAGNPPTSPPPSGQADVQTPLPLVPPGAAEHDDEHAAAAADGATAPVATKSGDTSPVPGLVTPNTENEARERMRAKDVEREGAPAKSAADALAPATVGGNGLFKTVDSLFGWGLGAVSRSLEAAETVAMQAVSTLTPLDARAEGALSLVLTTIDPPAVNGVRVALERVFGLSASLRAVHAAPPGAAQIVGLAEARNAVYTVLDSLTLNEVEVAFAVCPYVEASGGEDSWVGCTLMILQDPQNKSDTVEAMSQGVPLKASVIEAMKSGTPDDYPHKSSGFAVTVDTAMKSSDWAAAVSGISSEQILTFCATVVLGRYRRRLAEIKKEREAAVGDEAQS